MGAKCAPAYAIIFLGWWEEKHVYPSPTFQNQVRFWHRFIDYIFFVWLSTRGDCIEFLDGLNINPHNIFLTYSISDSVITFLDLKVFVQDNRLATDLFRKPTATNALLDFTSFHPWHTKVGVPTGQFLRVRRNCTLDRDFSLQARDLTDRFRQRGYPKHVILTAFQRARQHDQTSLLSPKGRDQEAQTRFIMDYNWRQRFTDVIITVPDGAHNLNSLSGRVRFRETRLSLKSSRVKSADYGEKSGIDRNTKPNAKALEPQLGDQKKMSSDEDGRRRTRTNSGNAPGFSLSWLYLMGGPGLLYLIPERTDDCHTNGV
ncbi:unnamed protein product [Ranitomeya imitator]|uniref:Helix-turn-helix domain-containing protein n=1 Tax=Ranitomeya imitator TaxID=111125 RepID=A0ABN9LZ44_9NEOB|nr:unnamed protein product [Ranitomeya imitator]